MDIGPAIRLLRKQKGYTQEQLADFAHTTKSTISNLEGGHQGYSTALLQHLAQALGCPISKIFLTAETLSASGGQSVGKLPIELLFGELSAASQQVVLQLVRHMVAEQRNKK